MGAADSDQTFFCDKATSPDLRLSEEDKADLKVVTLQTLTADTRRCLEANFPPEQLPSWSIVEKSMEMGYSSLHELRSISSGELLSASLIVDYHPRLRGEPQFLLSSFAVTPEGAAPGSSRIGGSKQSRSKGYGTYLRKKTVEFLRRQKPHALGLLSERESISMAPLNNEKHLRRAQWQVGVGLLKIQGLAYFIPPLMHDTGTNSSSPPRYQRVADRQGEIKEADLLLQRFDGKMFIDGRTLKSIVRRLYCAGYDIALDDPFLVACLAQIVDSSTYNLG